MPTAILRADATTVSDGVSVTEYSFNFNGYCNRISVSGLQITEYMYSGAALLAERRSTLDGAGNAVSSFVRYERDTWDNVLSLQRFTSGETVDYEESAAYGNAYSMITSHTVGNVRTVYTYSADGKALCDVSVYEGDTLRERVSYTHDSRGNVLTETLYIFPGTQKKITSYSYADTLSRPSGICLDGLYPTAVTVSGLADADGNALPPITTAATYDTAGRTLTATDALGNVTAYAYDARGRLTRTDYADGTFETAVYDIPNARLTATNRAGYVTVTEYDERGNALRVRESDGTLLSENVYDALGRVIRARIYHTANTYSETRYTYDALGRTLSAGVYSETDALLSMETVGYAVTALNGKPHLCATHTLQGDANAPSTVTREYADAYGRTVRTARIYQQTELAKTYEYDFLDRLLKETNELGAITSYTYDYAGRTLSVTDALGASVHYTYDSVDNVLSATDALGNTVTHTYDVLGSVLTQTVPFDETAAQITKYAYDPAGNLLETRVSNHAPGAAEAWTRTVNTYDAMNRLASTTSYDGETAALVNAYTYNAYDQILTSAVGGALTSYTYDARGNRLSVQDAMGQSETYTCDLAGNVLTKTDRNGTVFTYTYDRLGRLLEETAVNGSQTEQRAYAYSLSGALIYEANGSVAVTRRYDCLGRMIEETESFGADTSVSRYAYNAADLRVRFEKLYNGESVLSESYEYDPVSSLIRVNASAAECPVTDGTQPAPDPEQPALDPYDFASYPELAVYEIRTDWMESPYRFRLVPLAGTALAFDLTYTQNGVQYGVCFEDPQYGGYLRVGALGNSSGSYSGSFTFAWEYDGAWETAERFEVLGRFFPDMTAYYEPMMDYYVYCGNTVVASVCAAMDGEDDLQLYLFIETGYYDFSPYLSSFFDLAETTETPIVTYTYDLGGNRISMTNANGTSTVYTYNKANLVTSVVNKRGTETLSSHTYTYYLDGNIRTETVDGETKSYEYDDLGRLTREVKYGIRRII